jgi:pilus assembly protein Flp/PilA
MRPFLASTLKNLRHFARDERGATAIEYALIAGFISVVFVVAATSIGTKLNTTFTTVRDNL